MRSIGIISGTGLDNPDMLEDVEEFCIVTSFGSPSSSLIRGRVGNNIIYLLARHGREHPISPNQVNFRANIQVLKDMKCDYVFATTTVGSLCEEIEPGHVVILDQFIDFTRHRFVSFHETFEPYSVCHTPMIEPFDPSLRQLAITACKKLGYAHHERGTAITIEGPRFSTRAESNMFRLWGAHVINMSIAPECALANEAGLPYASVAVTREDVCWNKSSSPMTREELSLCYAKNSERANKILLSAIEQL